MTPALERLAELVRHAEAKTRARKIESETHQVAEQFRGAELRARHAADRVRVLRPASSRALEQADADEQLLRDLVRKLALYKSSLGSEADAEQLIAASQAEIERTRRETHAELEETMRELEEARRELRGATDQYRQLRRELDRLQPELSQQFAADDRLLWDAEAHFPGGQLQLLAHEVDAGLSAFSSLGKLEQYSRLKVWIGRFRSYQASQDRETSLSEELQALAHRVFHQLKWLSRQYEPGYIEAFRQDFSTDWSAYVAEAQEQLLQAIETGRRAREIEVQARHEREREREREREPGQEGASALALSVRAADALAAARSIAPNAFAPASQPPGCSSLTKLKDLVARTHLPDEGLDQFRAILKQALADTGPADPELLRLVLPYREYISGDDGLGALWQNLERIVAQRDAESRAHQVD